MGFAESTYQGFQVDWFLPTVSFYELALARRRQVPLDAQMIMIWDAATLCVFKMMFFRLKDLADVEQIIRVQGDALEIQWVDDQLVSMYGARDPRCTQWHEIVARAKDSTISIISSPSNQAGPVGNSHTIAE